MNKISHIVLVLVVLVLVLLSGTGTAAHAATRTSVEQSPYQLDASIGYGSGPGDFDAGFGFNFGAGYTLGSIDKNLQARAEIGRYGFERDFLGNTLDFTRMPFDFGARYYIPVAERLRVFGQAMFEISYDDFDTFDVFGKRSKTEVNIGVTPTAGIDFLLNDQVSVFATAGVHLISDSYFSMQFGAAYHF